MLWGGLLEVEDFVPPLPPQIGQVSLIRCHIHSTFPLVNDVRSVIGDHQSLETSLRNGYGCEILLTPLAPPPPPPPPLPKFCICPNFGIALFLRRVWETLVVCQSKSTRRWSGSFGGGGGGGGGITA